MTSRSSLDALSAFAATKKETLRQIDEELAQLRAERREGIFSELEDLVVAALNEGWDVGSVAEAYTPAGKSPNRNAIYAIRNRLGIEKPKKEPNVPLEDYPFEWGPRIAETANGERTVYDVFADVVYWGPDNLTGYFMWAYDWAGGLDPVITESDPYPTTKFYKDALAAWLVGNPYPEGE